MKESHIKHENGDFWIADMGDRLTVYESDITHSTADSSYPSTEDGLSLAIARCNYLNSRRKK